MCAEQITKHQRGTDILSGKENDKAYLWKIHFATLQVKKKIQIFVRFGFQISGYMKTVTKR